MIYTFKTNSEVALFLIGCFFITFGLMLVLGFGGVLIGLGMFFVSSIFFDCPNERLEKND